MKRCSDCGETKPTQEFAIHRRRADGLQVYCKICKQERDRNYYHSQPKRKAACKVRRLKVKARNSKIVLDYLSTHTCVDCGNADIRVLEFDHVRGTKYREISKLRNAASETVLRNEIEKCDIRCANCHTIRTHKGRWKDIRV